MNLQRNNSPVWPKMYFTFEMIAGHAMLFSVYCWNIFILLVYFAFLLRDQFEILYVNRSGSFNYVFVWLCVFDRKIVFCLRRDVNFECNYFTFWWKRSDTELMPFSLKNRKNGYHGNPFALLQSELFLINAPWDSKNLLWNYFK